MPKIIESLSASRVDANAKVISGVKVLGLESRNAAKVLGLSYREFGDAVDQTYQYAPEALAGAVQMYEGVKVVTDHPAFQNAPDGSRTLAGDHSVEHIVGALRNVRFVAGEGLYADLHYLESHPFSARLVEIAERDPALLSLSHEASFDAPRLEGGRVVIGAISGVDCVALVTRGGTTSGLFESQNTHTPDAVSESWDCVRILQAAGISPKPTLLEAMLKLTTEQRKQYTAELAENEHSARDVTADRQRHFRDYTESPTHRPDYSRPGSLADAFRAEPNQVGGAIHLCDHGAMEVPREWLR